MTGYYGTENERERHREYLYLVTRGWSQYWVHCPICGSVNDGWTSGGQVRYSGGTVQVIVPAESERLIEMFAACTCKQGQKYHDLQGLAFCDSLPPSSHIVTERLIMLWDKSITADRPNIPEAPKPEALNKFTKAMAAQFGRYTRGELTTTQLEDNRKALAEQILNEPITREAESAQADIPF